MPRVEFKTPGQAIGKNTVAGMQSGIIYGFVGLVEALVKRFKDELKETPEVIATGGLVSLIASETDEIDKVDPFLTLDGLYYIAKINGIVE